MSRKTIKGYSYDEKEDEIGRGGFGVIFRAREIQDPNNEVVIKTIEHNKSPAKTMPMELKKRELEICQVIMNKSHENLVSFIDYEVKPSTTYLVMEFCGGGDFRGYLEEKNTLSESVIQQFLRQIVSGLKFLHDQNIIHRDMKPANILLSFTGEVATGNRYPTPENIILKIADFGLSRFLSPDDAASTEFGTIVYMAPERLERKLYSKEADVWSIGVIVYECLFGEKPKLPYKDSELPAGASKEIRALLQKLMAQEPQDRLTCGQILEHEFMLAEVRLKFDGERLEGGDRTSPQSPDLCQNFAVFDGADSGFSWFRRVFSIRRKSEAESEREKILGENSSSNPSSPSQPLSPKGKGGVSSPAANANYNYTWATSPTKPLSPQGAAAAAPNDSGPGRKNVTSAKGAAPEAKTGSPKRGGFFAFFQSNSAPLNPTQEAISTHLTKSLLIENHDVYGIAHLDMRYYVLCRSPNVLLQYSDVSQRAVMMIPAHEIGLETFLCQVFYH